MIRLEAGELYLLAERIARRETSTGGVIVPRRGQEETDGAVVISPGKLGRKHGIETGHAILVRQHCGIDFLVGGVQITAFQIDNDEVFGLLDQGTDLDERNY